ncbi:endonuclease/exonuclease/phosphatase family protein [Nocardiopsis lambiniae]|uniref:Endonuclease/exonuclease/phosphatase family protein n=1 Tax=Nocardiopsis lambiniae TaxID=3075539 RepID=A0ABU2MD87_9ACTN|nr:endonuclease/exonuclease/phosphatase family protein [Nocardiopsis sp. DSM 44743]MDT0330644.1 endonuclease/exonuclease/phosphatase family protein [Nocardiopsis sp. DSM 44743]
MTTAVTLVAVGFAVFAALRGLGLERGFPLVPLLAYTPYVAGAAVLAVTAAGLLRRWIPMAVLAVAAAVLVVAVVPRAVPFGITHAGGPAFRVMTLNTLVGGARTDEIIALVRDREVDVLALQEVTPEFVADLSAAGLDDLLPYTVDRSGPGVTGGTVHSSMPLTDAGSLEGPHGFAMPVAAFEAPGDEYERTVEVVSVHTPPPLDPSHVELWRTELAALGPPETGPSRILAGDFNATLDHAALRDVLNAGYLDAAAVLGEGLTPTWPALGGSLPPVTIDHVLVEPFMGVDDLETVEVTGSDHRAVLVTVTLPGGR